MESPLAQDWKSNSYWLDGVRESPNLPVNPASEVDVLVVGSGFTGLNASIQTAKAGRSTMVLDALDPGLGCSTRNGGQISTSVKPSLDKLTTRFGLEKALAIRKEGETALQWISDFVEVEKIACDFKHAGRFHAAHTPKHYDEIAFSADKMRTTEGIESYVVPRSNQRQELGSDAYYGGVVFTKHSSLNPAKYHRGLLDKALSLGVHVTGNCAVQSLKKVSGGFLVSTEKGTVRARDVIVATNGYTTSLTPWLQRRVIPIGSYIIATEPLPEVLMNTLFPKDRIASDTCKVVYYYRASPDRKRILFGGRVSARETNTAISGPKLYQDLCRIFPELSSYKITHSWMGFVAYTFDELAHTGVHDGVHYAMGYCGSGVSMASYLGMRLGQKVLGLKEGQTAFDGLPQPTRPFYSGKPWFLPAAVGWYRWRDRFQCQLAASKG